MALADGDTERATIAAYATVREHLQRRADLSDALTHREFLAACNTQVENVDSTTLSTVADAYERVTFVATVDADVATDAVTAAATVLSQDDKTPNP